MASSKAASLNLLLLLVYFIFLFTHNSVFLKVDGSSNVSCFQEERKALLEFKQGLKNSSSMLLFWVGEDCCKWDGILCNNQTGNVIGLNLPSRRISGTLPTSIGRLSHLETLDLSSNSISGPLPASIGNLSQLQYLDLSFNSISGSLPSSIGNLKDLRTLNLYTNSISGLLPTSIGNLKQLQTLGLSGNSISGPLPTSIGNLSHLQALELSANPNLNGAVPESIGKLGKLQSLGLFGSSLEGIISENHFHNLTKLEMFHLSSKTYNSFVFQVSHDWIPVFNLTDLWIQECELITFPAWLKTQKSLRSLRLPNVNISDTLPDWFWRASLILQYVDLSNNQLRGKLPNLVKSSPAVVYLENNRLEGSLPLWPNVNTLSLANNGLSGSIPSNISDQMPMLAWVDLSGNNLSGIIPTNWTGLASLQWLDLSDNNLSGQIPSSMCLQLPSLQWLRLRNNSLFGELEFSLDSCRILSGLDLTGNEFSGAVPKWMGNLPPLSYLLLGANMFTGNIPQQLCGLSSLQVLDLSHNNLSGFIPRCLGNLEQLKKEGSAMIAYPPNAHVDLNVKGVEYEYTDIGLKLVSKIDLSSNNLWGEVPEEIKNLTALQSLNLSWNHLTGKVPEGIGSLQKLEALDLSSNNLSGRIPLSMTSMTSLHKLNLSHNNFSGRIPSGNQFNTFNDPSMFEGNSGLCGPPLPTDCGNISTNHPNPKIEDDKDKFNKLWFYGSATLGFIVGFWVVFGSLVIKRSWRHAYFRFLDKMKYRLLSFW